LVGIASLPVEHRRAAAVTQRFEVEVEGAQGAEHAGTRVTPQKSGRAKPPPSAMRYWVTMSAQSLRPAALRWLGGFGRVFAGKGGQSAITMAILLVALCAALSARVAAAGGGG
jgi:hypothetical protein